MDKQIEGGVVLADVVATALDVDAHLAAVESPRQGAVSCFVGRVRDHDPEVDGEVIQLAYSAHPDAPQIIRQIAERVWAAKDPEGQARVAITHRTGDLGVGDIAIVAAVSSPHRRLAFDLCEELVEAVKRELPVWKHQHAADGTAVWSGLT